MTDLEVVHATGEIVGVGRMTPDQAAAWSKWVRDLMRSALTEGVDYGVIPHTGKKPTMYKSGGEMLLRAAGLGFTMQRLDDDDYARDNQGVTYRCTVVRPDGSVVVECDGYCGRDEAGKATPYLWNSIVKMAQKRAMVGAALNATASSGLFTADLDDEPAPPAPPRPADVDDPLVPLDEKGFLRRAISELSEAGFEWFDGTQKADPMKLPLADANKFRRSHRDRLAWHILVAQQIKPAPLRAVDPEEPF